MVWAYVVMAYIEMAYTCIMACPVGVYVVAARIGMAYVLMICICMAYIGATLYRYDPI